MLVAALGVAFGAPARAAEPGAESIVAYTINNGREIAESLTGEPGDAGRGRLVYEQEGRAGCPACHGMPGADVDPTPASNLAGVGERSSAGEIRLWIVAAQAIDEDTSMPAYYAAGQRDDPDDPLYGGPALTAAEIEDLVAYLLALRNLD